jgi:methionyl-tRNA formyltransferase
MKIAYFGLPLGALLLVGDGVVLGLVALPPVQAPGRRRLGRSLDEAKLVDCISGVDEARLGERLQGLAPDALLSWFWTRKLPGAWLASARLGGFGVHPSLLPRHRGPDPYFAAIDAGDEFTGATLHRLSEQYDAGAVIQAERIRVGDRDSWQLARAIDRPSLRLLRGAAHRLRSGDPLAGRPQDELRATWAGEPEGDQVRVNWHWPTERVLRRVRALAPAPGVRLSIRGLEFTLLRAREAAPEQLALRPGEAAIGGSRVTIRTGDGAIALEAVELSEGSLAVGASELAERLQAQNSPTQTPET